jgi:hypothetical protein
MQVTVSNEVWDTFRQLVQRVKESDAANVERYRRDDQDHPRDSLADITADLLNIGLTGDAGPDPTSPFVLMRELVEMAGQS